MQLLLLLELQLEMLLLLELLVLVLQTQRSRHLCHSPAHVLLLALAGDPTPAAARLTHPCLPLLLLLLLPLLQEPGAVGGVPQAGVLALFLRRVALAERQVDVAAALSAACGGDGGGEMLLVLVVKEGLRRSFGLASRRLVLAASPALLQ